MGWDTGNIGNCPFCDVILPNMSVYGNYQLLLSLLKFDQIVLCACGAPKSTVFIALCAEKAHLVTDKAQKVTDWPRLDPETMKEVRRKIDTGWNIHL